jgi:serine/threonine-protein kinase
VSEDVLESLKPALSDRYTIEGELGRGGMAVVYSAHDIKHSRKVAIKVLRPEFTASIGVDRFLREVEIAARLTHPHVLSLHDSGKANGFLYYVMPFVSGGSLRDWMNAEKQLAVEDALRVTSEVADALDYAHSQGIVHRDIKPENIMFEDGHAVVTDFGIARAVSQAESRCPLTGRGPRGGSHPTRCTSSGLSNQSPVMQNGLLVPQDTLVLRVARSRALIASAEGYGGRLV